MQEALRIPNKMNPNRPTMRHIIIIMAVVKKETENFKSSKRKTVTHNGTPIILSADFSMETFRTRRYCHEIIKVVKSKDLQPRLFCPARP